MIKKICSIAILSGCTGVGWQVPVRLHASADDASKVELWTGHVQKAAFLWDNLLLSHGCDIPFYPVDDVGPQNLPTYQVRLVPNSIWHDEDSAGIWSEEGIVVRSDYYGNPLGPTVSVVNGETLYLADAVILHELGHALGFEHIPESKRISIMNPHSASIITEEDVLEAMKLIGCEEK